MNFKSISYYLSYFCLPVSLLSLFNIIYSYYFNFFLSLDTYVITLILSLFLSGFLFYLGRSSSKKINLIEQLLLIIFVYFLVGFLISLPYYLSNFKISYISAFFEAISGLTGTGFSIFNNIKYLDPTLIIWRSSSQWIGGLYFLIFLIFLFSNKIFNFKMTQLTFSENSNFISEENIKNSILKIFIFYVLLSFIFLFFLKLSGVRLFNSLNLSMTIISGGGFLPSNSLVDIIKSNFQKIVLIFSLLLSMLNFYILMNLFSKKSILKNHKEDIYLIITAVILIMLVFFNNFDGLNLIAAVLSSLANSGISK